MNKTECATRLLCTILGNEKLLRSLRARFREQYLRTHPEAVQAQERWRVYVEHAKAAHRVFDLEERLTIFAKDHPKDHAQLMALLDAVEVDAVIDHAALLAEKMIKRTT